MRSIRRLFIVAGIVLLLAGTTPLSADCEYYCINGYDWAECWLVSNGPLASCNISCDCMGWECACWCYGSRCYWT